MVSVKDTTEGGAVATMLDDADPCASKMMAEVPKIVPSVKRQVSKGLRMTHYLAIFLKKVTGREGNIYTPQMMTKNKYVYILHADTYLDRQVKTIIAEIVQRNISQCEHRKLQSARGCRLHHGLYWDRRPFY